MAIDLNKLKNRRPEICGKDLYRDFSVLLPLIKKSDGYYLLFEVRAENLNQQPKEICFPGGKIEYSEGRAEAAVRETSEELLIPESSIQLAGELDTLVTPFNTVIYPFTGILHNYRNTFNTDEVKEIFYVPLSFLLAAEPLCSYIDISMKPKADFPYEMIQGGRNYPWGKGGYPVYFYTYQGRIIWGITARIIHNFIGILKESAHK